MIRIIRVTNPIDPSQGKVVREWTAGPPLENMALATSRPQRLQ